MQVINFSEQNSIINLYMSELRDKNYQKNRLLFRHNYYARATSAFGICTGQVLRCTM